MSEDFRRGFLYALASSGLTPEEFGQAVLQKRASLAGTLGKGVLGLGDMALATAIGVPAAAGAAGGLLAAHLTRPDYDVDVQELKNRELVRQLRQETRAINRRLLAKRPQNESTPLLAQ